MTGIGLTEKKPPAERSLLRPRQVTSMNEEVRRIEEMLKLPASALVGVDVPAAIRQRNNMKAQLEVATPQPVPESERDAAVREEARLREGIQEGMCTQAEMRRNPPGAVDKHRSWEKRNKESILKWKNLRLRMHAAGMLGNLPADATDVANVETFRPVGGSRELSMDHAQIPQTRDFHFPHQIASHNHASDEDRDRWESETLELLALGASQNKPRPRELLVQRVGEKRAEEMIERYRREGGVPPEIPAERTTKPQRK